MASVTVPDVLHFGSWIGGDRDGNPFVKPETTALAVRMHNQEILQEYVNRVEALGKILTHSDKLITPSKALTDSIKEQFQFCSDAFPNNPNQYEHEPYRRKLRMIRFQLKKNLEAAIQRIDGVFPDTEATYKDESDFLRDLNLISDSLSSHGDRNIANDQLKDLIRLVETFGFYLVKLDLRQESTRHSDAVNEICTALGLCENYSELPEHARLETLSKAVSRPGNLEGPGHRPLSYRRRVLVDAVSSEQ